MTIQKKFILAVAVPLGLSLVFLASLAAVEIQTEALAARIDATRKIVTDTNVVIRLMYQLAAVSIESQLQRTTESVTRSEIVNQAIKEKLLSIGAAAKRNGHDDSESANRVQLLVDAAQSYIEKVRDSYYDLTPAESQAKRKTALSIFHRILEELSKIAEHQNQISIKQQAEWRTLKGFTSCFIGGGVVISIVVGSVIAKLFYTDIVRKLEVINANVRHIGKGEPLPPPMTPTDELANVDMVLHQMAERLEEAKRTKAELSSMLMHDVRTPLTSHLFFLELLAQGSAIEQKESVEGQAKILHSDMHRLLGLLDQLLDVQRLDESKLQVHLTAVSILDIVASARGALFGLAQAKEVEILQELAETELLADAQRLTQVLVNLLSNAIKYSPRKSTVWINGSCTNDKCYRISVVDNGKGIIAEFVPQLFERFTQAKGSDRFHSSGLGLYICKQLVEAQGGTIGFTSLAQGSSFWIDMPRYTP